MIVLPHVEDRMIVSSFIWWTKHNTIQPNRKLVTRHNYVTGIRRCGNVTEEQTDRHTDTQKSSDNSVI